MDTSLKGLAMAFIVALLLQAGPARAQQDTISAPVRIQLTDGSSFVGVVEAEDADAIQFRTASGLVMQIPRAQIRSMDPLRGALREGRYYRQDPNQTRLFFGPTARPLASGEGYVAAYELFFPFAAVGVADVATLAGGISLIPEVGEQLVYAAPKLTVLQNDRFALAGGLLIGTSTSFEDYGGLFYGVATVGQPERAVTGGVGFIFGEGEVVDTPILQLGGELQVSNSVKLLSENYIVPGADDGVFLLSGGLRFIGERLTADLGLFTSPDAFDEGGFPFWPWLGFAYNFGY